jgi:amidase
MEQMLAEHRDKMKPEAIWNIEKGLDLRVQDVVAQLVAQSELFDRFAAFMERYEYVLCAVNQVPPFDVDLRYPTEIDGVAMPTYISWMQTAYFITVTRHPAISVPCAFTPEGLPVGLQIVGRVRSDFSVLQIAHAFEQATETGRRRPPIVQ